MTRWDLVSQALRLDSVKQSQLIAQASILSRRGDRHLRSHRLPQVDRREARYPQPAMPAQVSVPGTEWQRAILGLGAAFSAHQVVA